MVVDLNAKEFIRWLFSLPELKRVKPLRKSVAEAVSRRLLQIASSEPDHALLKQLAMDVLMLSTRLGRARVASNDECKRFLNDYTAYLLGRDLKAAAALIANAPSRQDDRTPLNRHMVEYRTNRIVPFAPAFTARPRTRRRLPQDDISERICTALDALLLADCTRAATCVAEFLKNSRLLPQQERS